MVFLFLEKQRTMINEQIMSYARREELCRARFSRYRHVFHINTPEDFPAIFNTVQDYQAVIGLIAMALSQYAGISLFTFQVMSNHLHFAGSGSEDDFNGFFSLLKRLLSRYFHSIGQVVDLPGLTIRFSEISTVENLRNVIAYINRNGYLVHPDSTPFNYEWGANRFYFNKEAKLRYSAEATPMTQSARQKLSHSRMFDFISHLKILDGYVSPLCFCDVAAGEAMFRDHRQYFSKISKSIESYSEIAKLIGESIFYTDDELYNFLTYTAKKEYGCSNVSLLPREAKIALAKQLHYSYNAGNKQIARMLKLDLSIVDSLFLCK